MHAGSIQIRALGVLIVGVSCSYIACGGGGGGAAEAAAAAPSGTVSVSLSPPSPAVTTGATLGLTAVVAGTTDTELAWTVDNVAGGNASVGTVSGSGTSVVYTAPATAGTYLIKATSHADNGKSGSVTYRDVVVKTPVGWRIRERVALRRRADRIPDPS